MNDTKRDLGPIGVGPFSITIPTIPVFAWLSRVHCASKCILSGTGGSSSGSRGFGHADGCPEADAGSIGDSALAEISALGAATTEAAGLSPPLVVDTPPSVLLRTLLIGFSRLVGSLLSLGSALDTSSSSSSSSTSSGYGMSTSWSGVSSSGTGPRLSSSLVRASTNF